MSSPRGFGINGQAYYTNIAKPIDVNMSFIVDSADSVGAGIRSLKSNGYVQSVFMHTSATPASGNPNPAAGYAVITLKNNFNHYLGLVSGQIVPLAGSDLTSTTTGLVYVITALGTATAAQWTAAGVPAGIAPAVGVSFVALATASIGGSATVKVPGVPLAAVMSAVGTPDASIANSSVAQNAGAKIIVQFASPTNSSTTTLLAASPADGSIVSMCLRFDGSSVTIDGL